MKFDLTAAFRTLYCIRRVEEKIIEVYYTDAVKSPVHLSIGQESVSVGVCQALRSQDVVFATYRGHAAYLAKGGDLKAMLAELYGKVAGCARGKAGSMHLIDTKVGFMGTSAILATTLPQAVGYALALKMQQKEAVVACFFGEGSTDEGAFHESLNFAALKKLPILFVCENNQYAIYSHVKERMPKVNLCQRAEAYTIPTVTIPNGDTQKIYEKVQEIAPSIRAGDGPFFMECMTYRWRDHVGPDEDWQYGYRSREEGLMWEAKDQLRLLAQQLPVTEQQRIMAEVETEIAQAIVAAEQSPYPSAEELFAHVYAQ